MVSVADNHLSVLSGNTKCQSGKSKPKTDRRRAHDSIGTVHTRFSMIACRLANQRRKGFLEISSRVASGIDDQGFELR